MAFYRENEELKEETAPDESQPAMSQSSQHSQSLLSSNPFVGQVFGSTNDPTNPFM